MILCLSMTGQAFNYGRAYIREHQNCEKYGNAITVEPSRKSVLISNDSDFISRVPKLSQMFVAKAPNPFITAI